MSELRLRLNELSSAEDFFRFFDLPFDQTRLNVCRLHVMKRMGEYLARAEAAGDDGLFAACKDTLARAYADFERSTPLEQKVFKVLKDRTPAFVPLAALARR